MSEKEKCSFCEITGTTLYTHCSVPTRIIVERLAKPSMTLICKECLIEEKCPGCNSLTGGDYCIYCKSDFM